MTQTITETLLDTLADGRQLRRFFSPALASCIAPGQSLRDGELILPVFRHDSAAGSIDCVVPAPHVLSQNTVIINTAHQPPARASTCLFVTRNDEIFSALHALFCWRGPLQLRATVLSAFENVLPFRPCPSRLLTPTLPGHIIAAIPLLEDWGVLSRIAHADAPGCWENGLDELVLRLSLQADCVYRHKAT